MSPEFFEVIVTALLSGGLATLIMTFVNANALKRQANREDKKNRTEESDTIIDNYKDLVASYVERFRILNERLDSYEKRVCALEVKDVANEKRIRELESIIEVQEQKIKELTATNELYLERIKMLESEGNNGQQIQKIKQPAC
jgi:vacuolar-type H+-ATPase subunit I/STV1